MTNFSSDFVDEQLFGNKENSVNKIGWEVLERRKRVANESKISLEIGAWELLWVEIISTTYVMSAKKNIHGSELKVHHSNKNNKNHKNGAVRQPHD